MLWSIFCGILSEAFFRFKYKKKKQGGIAPACFYNLTQLKICTKYYMEIDNYSVGLGYLKSFNSSCNF